MLMVCLSSLGEQVKILDNYWWLTQTVVYNGPITQRITFKELKLWSMMHSNINHSEEVKET